MATKKPKPSIEDTLAAIIKNPPNERPAYKAWRKVRQTMPAGVDPDLLHRALVLTCETLGRSDAKDLPKHCDDAIVRLGEHFEETQADWAFVMVSLRTGRGDRNKRLRKLLWFEGWLGWAGQYSRKQIAAEIKKMPEIVEGARAAYALDEDSYTSYFLPILAVDGSPDSLDLLLPRFEAVIAEPDTDLDWIRKDVVPLLPDNKHCRAFIERFDAAVTARTETSPARAFLTSLGMAKPPKIVKFTLTFKDRRDRCVYAVKADSTGAYWLHGRRTNKWRWQAIEVGDIAKNVPAEATKHVLLVGKGIERPLVDKWARSLRGP